MCDTFFVAPVATQRRRLLFAKNSDRQRNEAHIVEIVGGAAHDAGARVRCTYLDVPQVRQTHRVLLCRPYWTWGAEMGANERGVVIGNEAVHASTPAPETPALLGMDFIRLALERAATAEEAVAIIVELLQRHGQGGNCGHIKPAFYNNSFLIVDPREAFVLETIDRDWMVKRQQHAQAISNGYMISCPDRASPGMH